LESEKKERIINAVLREFAQKGFDHASTNEIVKEAGISKGLLFHYFKNKKDLFLFLYDYTLEILMTEFFGKMDLLERDIFMRWRQIALLKIEMINKYPEMFNFVAAVNFEESGAVRKELENRNQEIITSSYKKIAENIDISRFRENIDINRALNVICWTMEGLSAREQDKVKLLPVGEADFTEILTELDIYLDLLKKSFYKE
jgi:AcrR family transcriptional regulator